MGHSKLLKLSRKYLQAHQAQSEAAFVLFIVLAIVLSLLGLGTLAVLA